MSKLIEKERFGAFLDLHMSSRLAGARDCIPPHYTTPQLHYTTLGVLHYTKIDYTTLHYTALYPIALHNATLYYTTPHNTTLHCDATPQLQLKLEKNDTTCKFTTLH